VGKSGSGINNAAADEPDEIGAVAVVEEEDLGGLCPYPLLTMLPPSSRVFVEKVLSFFDFGIETDARRGIFEPLIRLLTSDFSAVEDDANGGRGALAGEVSFGGEATRLAVTFDDDENDGRGASSISPSPEPRSNVKGDVERVEEAAVADTVWILDSISSFSALKLASRSARASIVEDIIQLKKDFLLHFLKDSLFFFGFFVLLSSLCHSDVDTNGSQQVRRSLLICPSLTSTYSSWSSS
jgi:hypothetical protein